jgi:DNA-binding CsgD family transcriptional regulator
MTDRRLSNLKTLLHSSEREEALRLWNEGKDTGEIKSIMGATEAAVYNALHELRGPRKKRRRLAA